VYPQADPSAYGAGSPWDQSRFQFGSWFGSGVLENIANAVASPITKDTTGGFALGALGGILPLMLMGGRGLGGLKKFLPFLALTGGGAALGLGGLGALPMALLGGGTGALTGYMVAPMVGIDAEKGAIMGGLIGAGGGFLMGRRRSRTRTRVVYRNRRR